MKTIQYPAGDYVLHLEEGLSRVIGSEGFIAWKSSRFPAKLIGLQEVEQVRWVYKLKSGEERGVIQHYEALVIEPGKTLKVTAPNGYEWTAVMQSIEPATFLNVEYVVKSGARKTRFFVDLAPLKSWMVLNPETGGASMVSRQSTARTWI